MLTLRLTQHPGPQPGAYRVEVALEGDNQPRQTATAPVRFSLSRRDRADLHNFHFSLCISVPPPWLLV